jgi:autotransporter adhesin
MAQLQAIAALVPTDAVEYDDASHSVITLDGAGGTLVTNVAPGTLSATSTDAVNGAQLFATNQQVQTNSLAIANLQVQVTSIASGAAGPVQYSNPGSPAVPNGGTPTNDVTLVGAAAGPVGLHNVGDGMIAAGSTDAVNGGQLFLTNQAVTAAQGTADEALATANNSVQYDDPSHTSVTFNSGGPVTSLHNVAAGTASTDAVNVGQLGAAVDGAVTMANAYTDARISALDLDIRDVRREGRAGAAAALAAAGMPQVMEPGRNMIAAGVGTYRGRSAIAIGFGRGLENGRGAFKLGLTYDSSEKVGANAGVGFQF